MNAVRLVPLLLLSSFAFAEAPLPPSCQSILKMCQDAGFIEQGTSQGKGLYKHCVNPIMQGINPATIPGISIAPKNIPRVPSALMEDCKDKLTTQRFGTGRVGMTQKNLPPAPEDFVVGRPDSAYFIPSANGKESVLLSWKVDPAKEVSQYAGGPKRTGFEIQYSSDGGSSWTQHRPPFSEQELNYDSSFSTTVKDLIPNKSYLFRISAINADGMGPSTTSKPFYLFPLASYDSATLETPNAPVNGFVQGIYAGAARGWICGTKSSSKISAYVNGPKDKGGIFLGEFAVKANPVFATRCAANQIAYDFEIPKSNYNNYVRAFYKNGGLGFLHLFVYAVDANQTFLLKNSGFHSSSVLGASESKKESCINFDGRSFLKTSSVKLYPANRTLTAVVEGPLYYIRDCSRPDEGSLIIDFKVEYSITNGDQWLPLSLGKIGTDIHRKGERAELVITGLRNNNNYQLRFAPITSTGEIIPWINHYGFENSYGNNFATSVNGTRLRSDISRTPVAKPTSEFTNFTPVSNQVVDGTELGIATSAFTGRTVLALRRNCEVIPLRYRPGGMKPNLDVLAFWSLPDKRGYILVSGNSNEPHWKIYSQLGIELDQVFGDYSFMFSDEVAATTDRLGMPASLRGLDFGRAPAASTAAINSCPATLQIPFCARDSYEDENGICQKASVRAVDLTVKGRPNQPARFQIGPSDLAVMFSEVSVPDRCYDWYFDQTNGASWTNIVGRLTQRTPGNSLWLDTFPFFHPYVDQGSELNGFSAGQSMFWIDSILMTGPVSLAVMNGYPREPTRDNTSTVGYSYCGNGRNPTRNGPTHPYTFRVYVYSRKK